MVRKGDLVMKQLTRILSLFLALSLFIELMILLGLGILSFLYWDIIFIELLLYEYFFLTIRVSLTIGFILTVVFWGGSK